MAVYTKVSKKDLEELLAGYDVGKLEKFTAIAAGIQNSNYFIDTTKAKYVLTIYEDSVNDDDLPFFLGVMDHFAKHDVPCPLPIQNKGGEPLSKIKGKLCAIVSFVQGHEDDVFTDAHIIAVGKNLAKMHLAGHDFTMQRENDLSVGGWFDLFSKVKSRADEFELGIAEEIDETLHMLKDKWPKDLPKGAIHSDLFPDNVLFNDDATIAGIIDFYFACSDFYMYDFAVCLNAWCFDEDYKFNKKKAKLLFDSYNAVRKVSDAEYDALPILASGAAMRFFLTRIYDWLNRVEGVMLTPKAPLEYLQKLRFHLADSNPKKYGF